MGGTPSASLQEFFFTITASTGFILGSSPLHEFVYRIFFRGQVPCWEGGGDADSTVVILILTLVTIWLPGTCCFKQIIFLLHTVVLLYCQNYTPGPGNITKYQTHLNAIAWLMGLHCIFVWCLGKCPISFPEAAILFVSNGDTLWTWGRGSTFWLGFRECPFSAK